MALPKKAITKPEGGFQFISVRQLCAVWCAYQSGSIRLVDVRVWFAAQELVARRCQLALGYHPTYTQDELLRLVGGVGGISSSLYRLRKCRLLTWEPHAITFDLSLPEHVSSALDTVLAQITNHNRRVPVPRRLLRFLASGCTRVLLATTLGHLFRCLYYRDGRCKPEGLCKASWIARVFSVSERAVKTARQQLEAIGFLRRAETAQWVLNRYGQKMTINLHWTGPRLPEALHPEPAAELAPLPAASPHETAPLDSHQQLPTEEKNQEPAAGGPTGVLSTLFHQAREAIRTSSAPLIDPEPVVMRGTPTPLARKNSERTEDKSVPLPSPTLRHIFLLDLKDTERLLDLHAQAIEAKLISHSEAARLAFVGLAQHVLAYRPENAGGLFRQLLTRRCFHFITQAEENAAQQRIKQHLYAARASPIVQSRDLHDWPETKRAAA